MIKEILILLWILIFPIADFILEMLHQRERISYELTKEEIWKLKKHFFKKIALGFIIVVCFVVASYYDIDYRHDTFNMIAFFEIIVLDFASLTFLWDEMYFSNLDERRKFSFSWFRKNWGWFRLLFPYYILRFFTPIYFIMTWIFIFDLSAFSCKILVFVYPIFVYFNTKEAYAIFRFYQQKRFQEKCDHTLNLLMKQGKPSHKKTIAFRKADK